MDDRLNFIAGNVSAPVHIRRNKRAKRMILRVSSRDGSVQLTLPTKTSLNSANAFLVRSRDWLVEELQKSAPDAPLGDGDIIPFMGRDILLRFSGVPPRKTSLDEGCLYVGGPLDMAGKRVITWLKGEAKHELHRRAYLAAETLGVTIGRIGLGDMQSRWGSCSSRRTLKFNWRLIMAPEAVLDYVVAHEVCHLLEMNHSPRFWSHVKRLIPDYETERKWLKTHGHDLMRIRF